MLGILVSLGQPVSQKRLRAVAKISANTLSLAVAVLLEYRLAVRINRYPLQATTATHQRDDASRRQRVYDYLARHGGASARLIANRLSIPKTTILRCLRDLERARRVTCRRYVTPQRYTRPDLWSTIPRGPRFLQRREETGPSGRDQCTTIWRRPTDLYTASQETHL